MLSQPISPGLKTALLAEDDPNSRDILSRCLQVADFEVVSVEDGQMALDMLEQGEFTLFVLDVSMPHVSGDAVLKRIRSHDRFKQTPVVIVTAHYDRTVQDLGLHEMADHVLNKPLAVSAFITLLKGF